MDKKTERMTIWLSEPLKVALMHLAAAEDRTLGEYTVHVLSRHVFGHLAELDAACEGAESGEARR